MLAAPNPIPVYRDLAAHYAEPHRHYHTLDHIEQCLRQFDLAAERMEEPHAVEMALWFHDVIYQPAAKDNELRSAQLFAQQAGGAFEPHFTQRVFDLVLVTTHRAVPAVQDDGYMVDIDLSGFGMDWASFKADSEAIRKEFAHVPDEAFYPRQAGFLRALLERPRFYFTDFFRDRYERNARENIARCLDELGARGLV
ncbi:MAG: hypothetical protein GWN84_22045 [Gammaproteobacteria bacterium]|nr:hypothetical protein [Gammaproteobacteria bacterium]NIR88851.1 hypothetical protein [Gammaproteobacteria bacterium]NIU06455.1 hypothetical protein [Gammaproteobacteria bacterium]NIV53347.1 hypothetical protein [Gammaproteobacteria bacterium]NIV74066.1 hypothetical protein [Gammaproteobacteria bacterium]